eukprot:c6136_g1_i1 orf=163-462(-)
MPLCSHLHRSEVSSSICSHLTVLSLQVRTTSSQNSTPHAISLTASYHSSPQPSPPLLNKIGKPKDHHPTLKILTAMKILVKPQTAFQEHVSLYAAELNR